jgi:nucleoside-diphosphate-sugar epimerase
LFNMRVFMTGATGFIGSAIVRELLGNGHEVTGLARSDKSATALADAGVGVVRGTLEDLAVLRAAAADADGVIHVGYIHDFSPTANPTAFAEIDKNAIGAFGDALAGTGKPLVVAAGLPGKASGETVTEDDLSPENPPYPRFSEPAALAFADRGVRVSVVRMPPSVHGAGDPNFVLALTRIARAQGVSAYVGEGANVWSAVHRLDAARLFRLALHDAPAGTLLNAVGDEGVPFRDIAAAIGRQLDVPVKSISTEEAAGHFGMPFALFAQLNAPASGEKTRQRFGWSPVQPGLIADINLGRYRPVAEEISH